MKGQAAAPVPPAPSEFARRAVLRAEQLGMGPTALAERAGLSRQTLRKLMALGRHEREGMPSVRSLLCLSAALRVHPFWLVEGLLGDVPLSRHLQSLQQGDRAGYVDDIDTVDGSVVAPGARIVKTWTAQNLSTRPWVGRKLIPWDHAVDITAADANGVHHPVHRLHADVNEVVLPEVPPGGVMSAQVRFTAPLQAGLAVAYWVPIHGDGRLCYDESAAVWVSVCVSADPAALTMFPHPLSANVVPPP